jgi:hypothetical protein
MGGVSDVGSKARSAPQPMPEAKEKEKPQEKPEAAEKPKEEQESKASKEPAEVEAEKITAAEAAKENPEVDAAKDPSTQEKPAADEQYYQDGFTPAEQARKVANNAPPLPPQGEEIAISQDIKTSPVSGLQVEASAKVTNTKVEPGLTNTVTMEASASIGRYVGVEAGQESKVSAGDKRIEGQKFTYETKVTKEQEEAIRNGTAELPNPFDPRSMPEGSAAVLKGQNYKGTDFEFAYRHIATEAKVTDLQGVGMSVEKQADNKVRISSGPVKAIENEAYVGLAHKDISVGLKNKQGLENTTMRVADLDLSTQEGLDKYHRFLITGQVPEADGNTVTRSGTTQTLKLTNETSAQVSLGPVDISKQLLSTEGERKTTQYTDGSKSDEVSLTYGRGSNLTISKEFDFLGNPVTDPDKPTYALTMGQLDPRSSSSLAAAYAEDPDSAEAASYRGKPAQDAQISFTPEQAQEMQRMATEYVQNHNDLSSTTLQDAVLTGTSDFMQQVALARNADEVAAVFAKASSNGRLADDLMNLRADNPDKPLPGTLKLQNSP